MATVLQGTRREDKDKGGDGIHVSTFIEVYLQPRCSVSSILPVGLNFRLTLKILMAAFFFLCCCFNKT